MNLRFPFIALFICASSAASPALAQAWPDKEHPVPPAPSNLPPGKTEAPKVTDIWVIFKTHCDLGYTASVAEVNRVYRENMMDSAIRLLEADKAKPPEERFKWTIAGWPMARNILGPLQTPARREKIEAALKDGSFAVHAMPASLEADTMDEEEMARGFIFSSQLARKSGQPLPISAKMTDVPGQPWVMPSLCAHAGVKFLQIGANYANRPMLLPRLFWWEGPDGSRVLCNFTPAYGSDVTPPKNWPAKNYLAVQMTHDNSGPPLPHEVAQVRAIVAKMPGVRLHLGTMDDFAKAVLAENPELPVVKGDMVDQWVHGMASMPKEAAQVRNGSPRASALGALDTAMRAWGLATPEVAPDLADAYENAMLYGEHTYGAMCPWYGFWAPGPRNLYGDAFREAKAKGLYRKFESSFEDKRNYARRADAVVSAGLDGRLGQLAKAVKADGDRVVVFNSLPWSRSGAVEVPGKPGVFLFAKDVPAGGYKTFPLAEASAGEERKLTDDTLETAFYKAKFDLVRGGVSSLVEKSTGRELVDQSSPRALGQFLHETFSSAQAYDYYNRCALMDNTHNATVKPGLPGNIPYAAVTPAKWNAVVRRTPAGDTVTLTAGDTLGLAKGVSIAFTFAPDAPKVEVAWREEGKKPDTIPEGGWLCFPLAVESPRFLVGRVGGTMDVAKDQLLGGNRHLFGVNSGVSVTAQTGAAAGTGVALCAADAPTMSFGEPGLWKYTFDYLPKKPEVFVHLYNNQWNTNFPVWIEGDLSSRVTLWPVAKAGCFAARSWETRAPLLAGVASGPAGALAPEQSGVALSRSGVLVTAFGADPDGNPGTLLRVWNQGDEGGPLIVTLPFGFKAAKATPVTLRGEKTGEPLPVKDGKLTFDLGKFAPASFILE